MAIESIIRDVEKAIKYKFKSRHGIVVQSKIYIKSLSEFRMRSSKRRKSKRGYSRNKDQKNHHTLRTLIPNNSQTINLSRTFNFKICFSFCLYLYTLYKEILKLYYIIIILVSIGSRTISKNNKKSFSSRSQRSVSFNSK